MGDIIKNYSKKEIIDFIKYMREIYEVVRLVNVGMTHQIDVMLEAVTRIDDDTLFGAYGKEEFIQTIIAFNHSLYTDPLTKAYNRRYYDSQLSDLTQVSAIAMMDVDYVKGINDIRKKIEEMTINGYPDIRVSVSIGAINCKTCSKGNIQEADRLLYVANKNRNCVCCA